MQDMEFTVQNGRLFMLQTRNGKRTAASAVRIAVDLVKEGLLDKRGALKKVDADSLAQRLPPAIDPSQKVNVIAKGLGASPGAAVGKAVFSAEEAVRRSAAGEAVVLVRNETSPEDIKGMSAARGILTARGGLTSHAAVVARQMGKCCVTGCSALEVHAAARRATVAGRRIGEGDWISLNGTTGEVIFGKAKLKEPE